MYGQFQAQRLKHPITTQKQATYYNTFGMKCVVFKPTIKSHDFALRNHFTCSL